jgi:8-amino-7-oxononanoate synthase
MNIFSEILAELNRESRLRSIPHTPPDNLLDLSSNDYLSLGERWHEFTEEFNDRFPDAAFSSSASRLLSARQHHHEQLEDYLAQLYGRPALLFNSGYHANVGCVGALTLPSALFVCDKLIHASIVDGLRIAGSQFKRFPHNDIARLRILLEKEATHHDLIVVVVESIYSMDGDMAPLRELVELKRSYPNLLLYVDEAHAFGVRGEKGLGLAEELGVLPDIDFLIGTFGKAAASAGAFVVTSREGKDFLVNRARPFIFSTALPPVNAAWSHLMTEKITMMGEERKRLQRLSANFRSEVERISGTPSASQSQIIPFLTGAPEKALALASRLREAGFIALAIRRPTVPPGGDRIRFSLGADMSPEIIEPLFITLEEAAHEI